MRRARDTGPDVLQMVAFGTLFVTLSTTIIAWVIASLEPTSWMPTPLGFGIATIGAAALASLSLLRRPSPRLVVVAIGLLLCSLAPAAAVDLPRVSVVSLLVLLAAAASLAGALLLGCRRAGRPVPSGVRVALVVSLVVLTAASSAGACAAAYGVEEEFATAWSPGGHWLALGYRSNMGATDSGRTEVVVRSDHWRILRRQRTVFEAEGLFDPSVVWEDDHTLRVGRRVVRVSD